MEEQEIYKMAVDRFGEQHQVTKAIEELSELILELCREDERRNIINEITDVRIMCKQLEIIYGITKEELSIMKDFKLKRLENTLCSLSS